MVPTLISHRLWAVVICVVMISLASAPSALRWEAGMMGLLSELVPQREVPAQVGVIHYPAQPALSRDQISELQRMARQAQVAALGVVAPPQLVAQGDASERIWSGTLLASYVVDGLPAVTPESLEALGGQGLASPQTHWWDPLTYGAPVASLGALAVARHPFAQAQSGPLVIDGPGVALAHAYQGERVAGFALRLAAKLTGVEEAGVRQEQRQRFALGKMAIPVGPQGRVYPQSQRIRADQARPQPMPLRAVLDGEQPLAPWADRALLLLPAQGFDATQDALVTWLNALQHKSWMAPVDPFHGVQRVSLLLLLLYFWWQPRRWRGRQGIIIAVVGSVLLLNVELVLLLTRQSWVPMLWPVLFWLSAQLLLALRWRIESAWQHQRHELASVRRDWGRQLMDMGQHDRAFEQLRQGGADASACEVCYQLAEELERRRQFGKALRVYEHIQRQRPGFKETAERLERLRHMQENFPSAGGASPSGTLIMDQNAALLPTIGRFRVERELGRGAMGVVYLGSDPKIGRKVAIKTLALQAEFDGSDLDDVSARFYREAEAAGRLHHPNIITVYDVGEEHDLAYIAMDFVEGKSLDAYTKEADLLPASEVLEIGAVVAEALGYAHDQRIIHRDIKPGNVIYGEGAQSVKITDFGVACLTDDRKTRTGVLLGSPSYMSPEQVAGGNLDGRSDLFSLGVTLYQLLSGALPFSGDSLANLMYRITHDKPVPLSRLRPDLPPCVSRAISKSIHKQPGKRYADGGAMASALRRCREQVLELDG